MREESKFNLKNTILNANKDLNSDNVLEANSSIKKIGTDAYSANSASGSDTEIDTDTETETETDNNYKLKIGKKEQSQFDLDVQNLNEDPDKLDLDILKHNTINTTNNLLCKYCNNKYFYKDIGC